MNNGLKKKLQDTAVETYIREQFLPSVTVNDLPESLIDYQKSVFVDYAKSYATSFGMEMDDFLSSYMEVSSLEEMHEKNKEDYINQANLSLVSQAIAEDAGISVTEDDLKAYFLEFTGSEDYSQYVNEYGTPYIKQIVMSQLVADLITENAVLK